MNARIMNFNEITTKNDIFAAPLAGFSDAAYRAVAAEFGAGVTYTEMISARGLIHGGKNTVYLTVCENKGDVNAAQIFGREPDIMAAAVTHPHLAAYGIIDINMGCSVKKIIKCGAGAALAADVKLAEKVISACVKASGKPVTVKFRKGACGRDTAAEFAKMCEGAGAAAVCIHPRFSEQLYRGEADLACAAAVKTAVKIPVIYSGDITDKETYKKASDVTGADAVMIGRAGVGNPFIFTELLGEKIEVTKALVRDTILRQIGIMEKYFTDKFIAVNMRKHISAYLKRILPARERNSVTEEIYKTESVGTIRNLIQDVL